jgi:inner membrane transporter RhtA
VTLEPVVATLVGVIVLGQALPPTALLAIACVTAAAIGVTLSDRHGDESGRQWSEVGLDP